MRNDHSLLVSCRYLLHNSVVGTEAAYSRAEVPINKFLHDTNLPFVTSPMAKGVVTDESPLSVASARSLAIQVTNSMI